MHSKREIVYNRDDHNTILYASFPLFTVSLRLPRVYGPLRIAKFMRKEKVSKDSLCYKEGRRI